LNLKANENHFLNYDFLFAATAAYAQTIEGKNSFTYMAATVGILF
jgi:hypothetical protein